MAALLSDSTVVVLGPLYASKKLTTSSTFATTSLMSKLSLSSKYSSKSSKSSTSPPVVILGTINPRSPALPNPTSLRNLIIVDAFVDGKGGEYIVARLIAVSCSSSSTTGEGGVGGEDLIEMEIRIDIVVEGGDGVGGVGVAKMTALNRIVLGRRSTGQGGQHRRGGGGG